MPPRPAKSKTLAARKTPPQAVRAPILLVGETLAGYAKRGVFRGFSEGAVRGGKATFRIVWHRERVFEVTVDAKKRELRFPEVLTGVAAGSTMYRELRQFVSERQSDELPAHRRIDSRRARIRVSNRGGNVAIALSGLDDDYAYLVRKLVHLVHEIFMVFLIEGSYLEYMVEAFDLDPDRM
ncbi:MAG: hypothetical protein HYX69_12665 [Planctomycetia bacterium]|nr:hypothetical protein [Planctomycetia bacterium]